MIGLLQRNEKIPRKLFPEKMGAKTEPVVRPQVRRVPKVSDLGRRESAEDVLRIVVLDHRRSDLKDSSQIVLRQPDDRLGSGRKGRRAARKLLGHLKII